MFPKKVPKIFGFIDKRLVGIRDQASKVLFLPQIYSVPEGRKTLDNELGN